MTQLTFFRDNLFRLQVAILQGGGVSDLGVEDEVHADLGVYFLGHCDGEVWLWVDIFGFFRDFHILDGDFDGL